MSEYRELVKNFQNIRTYIRNFYIYGFQSREDYNEKSSRTYDNERRRIESWFSEYTKSAYSHGKKHVYIAVDSSQITINPLYQAWKSKSFTSNDIMLHFFLLDVLYDENERKLSEIADAIQCNYGVLFDIQTIRNKLKEYSEEGLIRVKKEGRSYVYSLTPPLGSETNLAREALLDAVTCFQGCQPFGFIGSTMLDNQSATNDLFRMKHDFLVHTLEDEILYQILLAIRHKRQISMEQKSTKHNRIQKITGVPVKLLVSTQTGRRYLCLYLTRRCRFSVCRLDQMLAVKQGEQYSDYDTLASALARNLPQCFGVSFGEKQGTETFSMRIYVNEKTEPYIINRLEREGRGGSVTRVGEDEYLYQGEFFDVNEASPWIKTFIGRILSLESSSPQLKRKFYRDMKKMAGIYLQHI